MLTTARCEISSSPGLSLLLPRAARGFRGTVRTTCHRFPLEKSLLVSWHQLVLVQPDTNRIPLCY